MTFILVFTHLTAFILGICAVSAIDAFLLSYEDPDGE
jgi:hypothetical protein